MNHQNENSSRISGFRFAGAALVLVVGIGCVLSSDPDISFGMAREPGTMRATTTEELAQTVAAGAVNPIENPKTPIDRDAARAFATATFALG